MAQESLEDLLRAATVRVEGGPKPGAGFFVAPGLVLTCVHVVGTTGALAVRWPTLEAAPLPAERVLLLNARGKPIPHLDEGYPDVALLRVDLRDHPCVALDGDWPIDGDRFKIYGFPDEGGAVVLTGAALSYRAKKAQEPTVFIDLAADTVKPGMSGAALLNLRTKAVCGIVVATRSPASPDGGLAVPWLALEQGPTAPGLDLQAANRAFHQSDQRWIHAVRVLRRRVRFRLPRTVAHFRGRGPEQGGLEQTLGKRGRLVVTQAITGLGGVGKTQLASRYVERHADDYDVVAWIRAEAGGTADLAELALELGVAVEGLGPEDRAAEALRWLGRCEERWLLVLDNVTSPTQLVALSPPAGDGQILVTSRHRGLDQFGPVLAVDVFDEDTAVGYLVARARRPDDEAGAGRVARELGGLPLALSHAGAYCSPATSFDDYLGLLDALPAAELFDSSPDVFYQRTVASTWRVSIEAAAAEAPLARPVLAMAACLAPDAIPAGLFDTVLDDPADPRQAKPLIDALNALEQFSLVDLADAGVSVHRLVQKTVRDDAEARQDHAGALAALDALSSAFPQEPGPPAWWPQCEQLLPHVFALGRLALPPGDWAKRLVALLNRASQYLLDTGGGERAIAAAEATADQAERILGPEHPDTLEARANLASSYWLAGRTAEAIAIEEQVLADRERILGPEHTETLGARNDPAGAYWSAGRTAEAIAIFEQVLADSERLLGLEHPHTLMARANLSVAYRSAGRTTEAVAIGEQAVADSEGILGTDHPDTLTTRNNLANSYRAAGRTTEAVAIGEQVLADRERLLGPDHPDTLTAHNNLADSYRAAGRTAEAVAIGEQVLADCEGILGTDHPYTLRTRSSLANSYRAAGRTAEAVAIGEQVLAESERLLGPEHPDTLISRDDLASWKGEEQS